ncbi:protein trapped in endoderm-1-like [Haliotis rufescens]|uniref:protein trapped in endoderm-1-like n=1 Tax=Haliotis rufescens TaxID=6454 RepID=UPI001EAFABCB|nr:protein trapped in endoderm-1-like [Haliotis rufescens]XP_048242642.1 protein trapped in endoderm-1-like [Haliotis rufescens]
MDEANTTDTQDEVRMIQSVCSFTISVLGMLGNCVAIYQIVSRGLYQQTCNVYILNLSINNLLTCVIVLPVLGANSFSDGWVMGSFFCSFFPYIMHSLTCIETSALILITVNRYVLVVHPVTYRIYYSSRRFNAMLLSFPVMFFLLLQLLPFTGTWGHFTYHKDKLYCTFSQTDRGTRTYIVFLCSLILVTTIPVLAYCYCRILWTYVKSKKRLNHSSGTPKSENDQSSKWLSSKQDIQLIRTVVIIMVCYSVTHIPFLVVNVVDSDFKQIGVVAYTFLTYLALSHTAINPVVYALLNTQINSNLRCCQSLCQKRNETSVHLRQTAVSPS